MLAFVMIMIMSLCGAAWSSGEVIPEWNLVSYSSSDVTFDVQIPVPEISKTGNYTEIKMPGSGRINIPGAPELPLVSRFVMVPEGSTPEILSVEPLRFESRFLDLPVIPHRSDVCKRLNRNIESFQMDLGIYDKNAWFPLSAGKITECVEFRGVRLARVEINPIKYNPVSGELKYATVVRVRIAYGGGNFKETVERMKRYSNNPFDELLREVSSGEEAILKAANVSIDGGTWPNNLPMVYLIITADDFISQAETMAEWKTKKGFETVVVPMSEIGSSAQDIIDFVQNAYDTWPSPPSYLLLLGDTDRVPADKGDTSLWGIIKHKTDLHYACVDGTDYIPDIAYGRFPVRSAAQAWDMVANAVYYERYEFNSFEWLNNTVFIAGEDPSYWTVPEETHKYVISNHIIPSGMNYSAVRGHFGGTTSDITSAVNAGAMFVNYSGHGSATSWADPGFSQSNVRNLVNTDEHPFVLSNACDTGKYDITESFAETWVLQGETGGLSFYGASNSTYWDGDDILERRLFDLAFDTNFSNCGEMTIGSLIMLYRTGYGKSHYYFEVYNLMGDPSIDLWFGEPVLFEVDYPTTYSSGLVEFDVNVMSGSQSVDGALVCIYRDDDVFEVSETVDGTASFSFYAASGSPLSITITRKGFQPFEGEIVED